MSGSRLVVGSADLTESTSSMLDEAVEAFGQSGAPAPFTRYRRLAMTIASDRPPESSEGQRAFTHGARDRGGRRHG